MKERLAVAVAAVVVAAGGGARADEGEAGRRDVPIVELYTIGQGTVVFERLGHAAICLRWYGPRRDGDCYNYGTTDFTRPGNVIWTFLRGESSFWVSKLELSEMLAFYRAKDRSIWRQRLPLSDERALAVAAKLEHDLRPENRHYSYHHFDDNCTTRLRDLVDDATGGALRRVAGDEGTGTTFRALAREGFAGLTPLVALSDFLVGREADVEITEWELLFLPSALREAVHDAVGAAPVPIYTRRGPPFPSSGSSGRLWVILFGFAIAAPVAWTRWRGSPRETAAVAVAAGPLFLLGASLWLLAILSDLPEIRWNEAVLVLWPTDGLLPFLGAERRRRYAQVRTAALVLISLLLAVGVLRQPLWAPMLVAFPTLFVIGLPESRRAAMRRIELREAALRAREEEASASEEEASASEEPASNGGDAGDGGE